MSCILAYIDPGSGSLIFQLLLAWLMGTLFVMRRFIKFPFIFFNRLFKRQSKTDE